MRSKSQILSKLRADGHITDEEYKLLEKEPKMVHRETLEQVMWERDVAITQLKELGYGLGEKPKTGHWIEDTNGTYTDNHDTWECSECGHAQILLEGTPKDNDYNYCPNCGAKMVEPQESEEE